jgi:pimeloyl-ACP methyl ester carboxylesterase
MSEEQGWRLIVTEIGIDTRTPIGKAMGAHGRCVRRAGARLHPRAFSGKAARLWNRLNRATGSGTRRAGWNAVSTELQGQGFTVLTPPNFLRGVTTDAP